MELSDVMRYHLELSKHGKVRLEEEIQLLESYIKLEQLRLHQNCDIEIDLTDIDDRLMISPLLFIPFVENAFKYGTHPSKPCFIHLSIKTEGNKVFFIVKNSIIKDRKVVKTNIGMQNTMRRLELIYPGKHNLNIDQSDNTFSVNLSVEL
jgi:LytS/YehU family sensor histidine kinase